MRPPQPHLRHALRRVLCYHHHQPLVQREQQPYRYAGGLFSSSSSSSPPTGAGASSSPLHPHHHHHQHHRAFSAVSLPLARSSADGAGPPPTHVDVCVVGAGHNGLAAAYLLARQGLAVRVVERADVAGGACRTEHPFGRVPGLGQSTGAYLLGVMPPELFNLLGLKEEGVTLLRRDPHYFLPTPRGGASARSLLLGADAARNSQQLAAAFGDKDAQADAAMQAELSALRDDLGPAWLRPPPPLPPSASPEDVARAAADRYVRPALRDKFVRLMTRPALDYVESFGFRSPLLKSMYVVTDGLSGLAGGVDDASTGPNFLLHNMCRLPGAEGTWMVVRGGMGSVTQALARRAAAAGARVTTGSRVASIDFDRPAPPPPPAEESGGGGGGRGRSATPVVTGVTLESGESIRAHAVLVNADPFTLRRLAGGGKGEGEGEGEARGRRFFSPAFNSRLDSLERDGFTCKVNLALRRLPTFKCLPDARHGQHRTTAHLLPGVGDGAGADCRVLDALREGHAAARRGEVRPELAAIEVYFHTTVDRSLGVRAPAGYHSAALFVQHVPYKRADGKEWNAETEAELTRGLLEACDAFADFSGSVADTFTLTPPGIERHFGMHRGHIHHVDNGAFFSQRFPYRVPGVEGLFCASAGTHPGGSVIGCGGHNSAGVVVRALGLEPWWQSAAPAGDGDGACGWE